MEDDKTRLKLEKADLRDLFAAFAVNGLLVNCNYVSRSTAENVSDSAYLVADEMLKRREKKYSGH